jgi:hypothetical protein
MSRKMTALSHMAMTRQQIEATKAQDGMKLDSHSVNTTAGERIKMQSEDRSF